MDEAGDKDVHLLNQQCISAVGNPLPLLLESDSAVPEETLAVDDAFRFEIVAPRKFLWARKQADRKFSFGKIYWIVIKR